jgi:hypothetical protein
MAEGKKEAEVSQAASEAAKSRFNEAVVEFVQPWLYGAVGFYENLMGSRVLKKDFQTTIEKHMATLCKDTMASFGNNSPYGGINRGREELSAEIKMEEGKNKTIEKKLLENAKQQACSEEDVLLWPENDGALS